MTKSTTAFDAGKIAQSHGQMRSDYMERGLRRTVLINHKLTGHPSLPNISRECSDGVAPKRNTGTQKIRERGPCR